MTSPISRQPSNPRQEPAPGEHSAPQQRIVLLGASNLTKGLSLAVETVESLWQKPLDIVTALGHGRSYGKESSVLGRKLPGILQCALWDDLRGRPPLPTAALIMDIGNDLIYGEEPSVISGWVQECVERLQARDARVAMTLLPLCSLERLSPWRFEVMRRLMFPGRKVSLEEIHRKTRELQERLRTVGRELGVSLIEHRPEWYGFDPIHVVRGRRASAWREIFQGWNVARENSLACGSWKRWLYLHTRVPHSRKFFGWKQSREQPSARLRSGSRLSIY